MSDAPVINDDMIRAAFQRRAEVGNASGLAASITAETAMTAQRTRWPVGLPASWHGPRGRPMLVFALLSAVALGSALAFVGSRPSESTEMAVVERLVDAINGRDVGSLRSEFTAHGILELPTVDGRAGREGNVEMSDWDLGVLNFPENWMSALETWGLEAELGTCVTKVESTLSCAVRSRWHVLEVEIGEEWTFAFDGSRVRRLAMARVDADPSNRQLPMSLDDLQRWATWLEQVHPDQADRLLADEPDLFGHFYFRFGPASPDEIGASIREYLESRDRLVGTYLCSDARNPAVTHLWDVRDDGTITRVSGETGEALSAGTWALDHGQLFTNFDGGMTWFQIDGDRLVIPGGWACTPGDPT